MRFSAPCAIVTSLLIGCSSSPPPPAEKPAKPEKCVEPHPTIIIASSDQTNAGPDGRGLPVQVRLYQLKSEAKLQNAFFEEVWKEDAKTLADDLVTMREVTVFPGQSQKLDIEQSPDSRVLTAVALFREPRGRDWFVSYDLALAKDEPPCPPPEPRISIWLDRMKIQDGEGRVQVGEGAPVEAEPNASGGAGAAGEGQ